MSLTDIIRRTDIISIQKDKNGISLISGSDVVICVHLVVQVLTEQQIKSLFKPLNSVQKNIFGYFPALVVQMDGIAKQDLHMSRPKMLWLLFDHCL